MQEDPYKLLGISRDATTDDVKWAFRRLAMVAHPDVSDREDATEYFQKIHDAYCCLIDEVQRREYDEATTGRGEDVQVGLWIDPQERDCGREFTKRLVVPVLVACGECHAAGWHGKGCVCPSCSGATILYVPAPRRIDPRCRVCDGRGFLGVTCSGCRGRGRVSVKKSFTVVVPAGVRNHDVLKLPGAGNFSPEVRSGDVLVTIRVRPQRHVPRRADQGMWH